MGVEADRLEEVTNSFRFKDRKTERGGEDVEVGSEWEDDP